MGIGAAFVMPVTLSVITTVFPPEERGKAVGTWVGVAAGGGVLGLLASGVLLEWLSWPSVFGLNVVLAALALAGTLAVVPATRESRARRGSTRSARCSSAAGLAALVYGIIEGPERGWTATRVTLARARRRRRGASSRSSVWELRRREPMLDPRNFLRRGFGAGLALDHGAVLRRVRLPVPGAALPAARAGLLAAPARPRRCCRWPLLVIPLSRVSPLLAGTAAASGSPVPPG